MTTRPDQVIQWPESEVTSPHISEDPWMMSIFARAWVPQKRVRMVSW